MTLVKVDAGAQNTFTDPVVVGPGEYIDVAIVTGKRN